MEKEKEEMEIEKKFGRQEEVCSLLSSTKLNLDGRESRARNDFGFKSTHHFWIFMLLSAIMFAISSVLQ